MFDLIGYWSVVSIASFIILAPFTFIFYLVAVSFMENVLGSDEEAAKVVDKLFACYEGVGFTILGQRIMHEVAYLLSSIVGFFGNIVIGVYAGENGLHYGDSLILFVSRAGEVLSPIAPYIIVPTALYYGAAYLTKKVLKVKAKLDAINTKLKEAE